MGRNEFEQWLNEQTNLSDVTKSNYINAIASISRWANNKRLIEDDIYNIQSKDFSVIRKKLEESSEYLKYNKRHHNVYSASFSKYSDYLKSSDANLKEGVTEKMNKIAFYKNQIEQCKNIVLRGAPGTGKTFLSRLIASTIIGCTEDELNHSDQFEFVQFHPSYDYTDFVEGLRPVQIDNQIGFEVRDGIFKSFCNNALYASSSGYSLFGEHYDRLLDKLETEDSELVPKLKSSKPMKLTMNSNRNLKDLNSDFMATKDNIYKVWKGEYARKSKNGQSRMKAIVNHLMTHFGLPEYTDLEKTSTDKKYVFVIDEINRGEISKIFGELFFSIDPGYRGTKGSVSTQYANLFDSPDKFYVPENVYIIGTMNDIDRSVDTFDFAMRRRFTFFEITANDSQIMLVNEIVKHQMNMLNDCLISNEIGLSKDYQIGASYFLSLDKEAVSANDLWEYKLEPLFKDYFRGEQQAQNKISLLKQSFFGTLDDTQAKG